MATVVTYWQLTEDENDFFDFLQRTGTIVALPTHWVDSTEELIPKPIGLFIEQYNADQLKFGLEKHLVGVRVVEHAVESGPRFALPYMDLCAITYKRGKTRDGKLTLSNLSAYSAYPSEDKSKMIGKGEEFIKWMKKVMAWVRKATPERVECNRYPYRATRRVKQAVNEGKLEVAIY